MTSAHIMNVSQTNNTILKNRVNQLTLELTTLKLKYTELEKNVNHDKQAIDNYATAFTSNTTTNEKFVLSNELEENPLWETQTKAIKNIVLKVCKNDENDEQTESNIIITLSNPFVYITNNDVHKINELIIRLDVEDQESLIDGITQFESSAQIKPFNSTTLFATKKQTNDNETIYSIGETKEMPRIIFESSDAPTFAASISSALFVVKP